MVDPSKFAFSLPDVTSGVACAGTALESRTFSINKKAFLFISERDVRLKLGVSSAEARQKGFAVGANGWVKIPIGEQPPVAVMKKWLAESHALMAPAEKVPRASSRAGKRSRHQ